MDGVLQNVPPASESIYNYHNTELFEGTGDYFDFLSESYVLKLNMDLNA